MNAPETTRKEILDDYLEILQSVCSQKISEILIFKNNIYRLPNNISSELFFKEKKSIRNISLLMAIIEKVNSTISFSEDGDRMIIDLKKLYNLPIEKKYFKDKKRALKIVKLIINKPVWKKMFIALILTNKERKDFDDFELSREITKLYSREKKKKELN
jgi:hypothetical protein